jgi:hypothetical protein
VAKALDQPFFHDKTRITLPVGMFFLWITVSHFALENFFGQDKAALLRETSIRSALHAKLLVAVKNNNYRTPYIEELAVDCFLLEAPPQIKSSSSMRKYGKPK